MEDRHRVFERSDEMLYPVGSYKEHFYRPDVVAAILRGESARNLPVLTARDLPPWAKLIWPENEATVEGDNLELVVVAADERPLPPLEEAVTIFVNGQRSRFDVPHSAETLERAAKLAGRMKELQPPRYQSAQLLHLSVPLPPGEEKVKVSARVSDAKGNWSDFAEVLVHRLKVEPVQGDLWALLVGVSQYQEPHSIPCATRTTMPTL